MAIQSSEQNISASDDSFDDDPIRFVNLEAINRIICRETECNAPSDSTDSLRRRPPSATPKGTGSKFLFGDGNRHIDSIAELNEKISDLGIEEAIHENSNFSVGTDVDFVASSNTDLNITKKELESFTSLYSKSENLRNGEKKLNTQSSKGPLTSTEYSADMEMEGYNCCSSAEIIKQCNSSTNQGLSEMYSSSEPDALVTKEETGYHTPKATNGHSFCKLTEQESCGNCSSFEPVSSFAKQKRDSHGPVRPVQKVLFNNITQREECGTCDPPESQCQKPTKMPGLLEERINKMQLALKQSSAQKKIKHNGVIDVSYLHTDISSFQAQKNTADKLKLKKQNIQRKSRKDCHKNKIGPLHDDQDENISGVSSACMVEVRRSTRLRSRQLELCKGVKNSASSTLVLEQMANKGTGNVSNISSDIALKCGEAALFIDKKERQTKKCRKSSITTSNVTSESDAISMNYHSKNGTKTHTNNEGLEHTKAEGRCRTELQSREVGSHGGSAKAEKSELPLQLDSDKKTRKVPSQLDSDNGQRALRVVTVNNMKQMKPKKKKMISSSVIAFRKAEKTLIERRKKKKKNLQAEQDWEHLKDAGMTWIPEVRCNTRGRPKRVKHCEESTYPLHAKPMAPSKADKLRIYTSLKPSKSRTSTKRNAMSLDIDRECNLKQNMGLQDNQGTATSGAAACRRSTRIRSRPLEYWKGERFLQGRIYDSLPTVIGIKYATPELRKKRNHSGNMKVESFVSTKYSALLRFAAKG